MKKLREKFDDHLTFDKILSAHRRASKSKGLRYEVLSFNLNEYSNLMRVMDILAAGKYTPSKYWKFWIYDPKKRLILALPYADRIVHQWVVEEFIKPYYIPRFIADSYACIPGRGTHVAADRIQQYMRHMHRGTNGQYYILKMDISKFFNSIDLAIMYGILSKSIADKKLLDLIYTILFDDGEHDGLPIGNYVSQYFANIYLNELDQFCKHTLKIRYYVRYMDDFVALAPNRKIASEWYAQIQSFITEQLNMNLNTKSRYYPCSQGLDFIGYRIYNDYRLLRKRSKRHLLEIIAEYEGGVADGDQFVRRINSWHGHALHADTRHLIEDKLLPYQSILPVVFPVDGEDAAAG